jgi:hypothetical protein
VKGRLDLKVTDLGATQLKNIAEPIHAYALEVGQVGNILVEPVGPQMRAGFGVDELRVDAHAILITLDRAFKHVADAKFFADLLGVDALAFVGESGVAREFGGEILGNAVGEIVL